MLSTDALVTDPQALITEDRDEFNNILTRVVALASAPSPCLAVSCALSSGLPDVQNWAARQIEVQDHPATAQPFLLGSRCTETDRLSGLAWSLFGSTAPGWGRVQAIVDYVHERIQFGYQHARPTRTAEEAHEEQGRGSCRSSPIWPWPCAGQ